jgi:hypothetical protein
MKNLPKNFGDQGQLFDEYNRLLNNYNRLKDENRRLKEQLGLGNTKDSLSFIPESKPDKYNLTTTEGTNKPPGSVVINSSDSSEKIRLYLTLFKGRDDVYAKRWENKKKGISGYSPVCLNEWMVGICFGTNENQSTCAW